MTNIIPLTAKIHYQTNCLQRGKKTLFLNISTSSNAGIWERVLTTTEFRFWNFDPGKKFEEMIYDAP